jgi:FixJ family two-component response regulator
MMAEKTRVLVADDQADVLEAMRLLLKAEDFGVETVTSPAAVLAAVEERDFDALLMDLNYTRDTTSGREGFDLLTEVQRLDATLPIIVMTAWGSIHGAVEAMRRGARDYIEKPWDNSRLISTLRTHVELGRVLRESQKLQSENQLLRAQGAPEMIVESRAMKNVIGMVERVGPSEANVLITGEHGTGKEVVARLLHSSSPRARKPLITVNAGGLSDGVFESELFGHVKGAFTDAKTDRVGYFELADGGTLFLDEIGNMPSKQQAKLLRALQSGEFQRVGSSKTRRADVRVITATNVDIRREVAEGRFREAHRLRPRSHAGHARILVAGQRARSRTCRRARRAARPGPAGSGRRPGPARPGRRRFPSRRNDPRGCRAVSHPQGSRPLRRQCQPGRRSARSITFGALSTVAALRDNSVTDCVSRAGFRSSFRNGVDGLKAQQRAVGNGCRPGQHTGPCERDGRA